MTKTIRMFVLAHAGGNSWDYVKLFRDIKGIEIVPIELAGDITKLQKATLSSITEYVDETYKMITSNYNDGKPFVLFGHSFGAYISYELSKRFQTNQLKLVFLSGCSPLHIKINIDYKNIDLVERHNNEELNEIIDLVNSNIIKKVDLVTKYRLDMYQEIPKIVNQYTRCCILCGSQDPFAVRNEEWKYYYNVDQFVIEYFTGGHFYWNENEKDKQRLLEIIQREINNIR